VGLGSGIFGGNIGTAFKNKAMLKNPQAARQVEIEQKDERNQAISNKSKARVYDLMIFVYAAVILAFALMQINIYVTLILVAIYLFFIFANVYYFSKYNKEM
jgi:nitrate/nitrite transporter NarK